MDFTKIDYNYMTGALMENNKVTWEIHPASYGLTWCMIATFCNRIFTRADLKELLFRMSITLHSMNIVESWLIDDRLLRYSVEGKHFTLTLDDIIGHFGIEIYDSLRNMADREFYLGNVSNGIRNAMFNGIFGGFSVIVPKDCSHKTKRKGVNEGVNEGVKLRIEGVNEGVEKELIAILTFLGANPERRVLEIAEHLGKGISKNICLPC